MRLNHSRLAPSRWAFLTCVIAAAAVLLPFTAFTAGGVPAIATDKISYALRDVITFTGTDWAPGEAIQVAITCDGGGRDPSLDATADGQGGFVATLTSNSRGSCTAIATGSSSGATAPIYFTELPPTVPHDVDVLVLSRGEEFPGNVGNLAHLPPRAATHRRLLPMSPLTPGGGPDPVAQVGGPFAPAPEPGAGGDSFAGSFAGLDFANWGDGWPPDTNGDVGREHYIQTVNTSIGIFASDGVRLAAFHFDALMSQGNFENACDNQNFGDPVVVYDTAADRWFISDFAFAVTAQGNPVAPYYECFAVSRTGDPVDGGWYFYSLQTNDYLPDYPKLGIWPDALYMTANMFQGNNFQNVRVWALNKNQMEAGLPAQAVMFNLPATINPGHGQKPVAVFTGLPSNYHTVTGTPPSGRPNLITSIWSAKLARVWKFHVDWTNTANSTLTGPSNVTLATWNVAPATVPAKNGNNLDTLQERLMMQSQYTNLGGTESLWLTHTVANPGNLSLSSSRWYQLNVTGGTVVTSGPLQQSTYVPDSTVARFMSSLAVDRLSDMALGYSASSSSVFPGLRYAGRLSTDPLSTLGQSETSLMDGTASQCCTFSNGSTNTRWGDYSAMAIDPNGCDFWYTNEFYQSPQPTTLAGDNWQTRIVSFRLNPSCTPISPQLAVSKSHSGNFAQGQQGATYTINVSNTGTDQTSGVVTVNDTLPAGLTASAINGTGWACTTSPLSCTRSNSLAAGSSYPAITLTVNVAADAPSSVTNSVTVSGGGSASAFATDPTTIDPTGGSGGNSATFVRTDSTTQGSWRGVYGSDGYGIVNNAFSYPAYASVTVSGASTHTWSDSTAAIIALQYPAGTNRIAATWYSDTYFTIDLNLTDGGTHQVALYALDWDPLARTERIDILDGVSLAVLDSRPLSGFDNGQFVVWNLQGHVVLRVTNTNPSGNAVISGLFFGGSSGGGGNSAAFVRTDATTQGSWRGVYGSDGYGIVNNAFSYPAYAAVTVSGTTTHTWSDPTAAIIALQYPTGTNRIAATWYSDSAFTIDLNLTGGTHQVAVYALDWDPLARTQQIDILDGVSLAVLDSRPLSGFDNGQYVVWNLQGHVVLRVTNTNPSANAVVSGLFFN